MATRQTDLTSETTSWTLKSGSVVTVMATLVKEEWDPAETGSWTLIGVNNGIPYRVVISASANGTKLADRDHLHLCAGHPSGAVASIGKLGISAASLPKVEAIIAACEQHPEYVAYRALVKQGELEQADHDDHVAAVESMMTLGGRTY